VPLFRTMAIGQAMDDSTVTSRQADALLKTIAAISALLALAGLYAITAHAVSHQVRELGVRAALGAGPRRLGWFVVRRATWHIVLGLGAGAGLTLRGCGSSRTALCSASGFSIRGRSGSRRRPCCSSGHRLPVTRAACGQHRTDRSDAPSSFVNLRAAGMPHHRVDLNRWRVNTAFDRG
jgi:hypothetical protein